MPITHLTFDCYGTLIDWETGILNALQPLLKSYGVNAVPEKVLRLYVDHEARLEKGTWRPYHDVLRQVSAAIAEKFGVTFSSEECEALPNSIERWPPFPDTVAALRRLKARFPLVILSNIDDALFAKTAKQLQVSFDAVVTAEQVRSYKPDETHFREALRRLQVPASQILHVAQSPYHDHVPAQRLGFRTAWINRDSLLKPAEAGQRPCHEPDMQVPDLQSLASALLS